MAVNTRRTTSLRSAKHDKIVKDQAHLNWMGGPSYDIGHPVYNLRLAASSCFFGEPMYYHDTKGKSVDTRRDTSRYHTHVSTLRSLGDESWRNKTPTELLENAIDKALDFDPESTLQEAVRLRKVDNIRTTPQVILVRAANHPKLKGTGLVAKYADAIVSRGDEPAVCMAYQMTKFGKPVPNALKRALARKLEGMTEYTMAKYRMEGRLVKTVDVVNMVHPRYTDAISKLVKNDLKLTNETWEALRSSGASWEQCIPVMGHMALLRNLRNFQEGNVNPDLYLSKLVDTVTDGKQLPFRYYTAYNAIKDIGKPQVLDTLEQCLEKSYLFLPKFPGRTICLSDNSGSAHGAFTSEFGSVSVADIGNLTAVVTGKNSEEGYVGLFGDSLKVMPVRKSSSTFDMHKEANFLGSQVGQGTENGIWLFWDKAIKSREHWDNVFVYSDMQAGHGGLYGSNPREYASYCVNGPYIDVPKLIMEYRERVNPKVNVFLVQTAGYQDTLIPEWYERTYILGGWSGNILQFAASMIQMSG